MLRVMYNSQLKECHDILSLFIPFHLLLRQRSKNIFVQSHNVFCWFLFGIYLFLQYMSSKDAVLRLDCVLDMQAL